MLLILGAALIAAAAILTAAAGMIYNTGSQGKGIRGLLSGQTFGVFLAALIGVGMVTLLAFLTEFKTQSAILLQVIVAAVIAAAGYLGVRLCARRTPPAEAAGAQRRMA